MLLMRRTSIKLDILSTNNFTKTHSFESSNTIYRRIYINRSSSGCHHLTLLNWQPSTPSLAWIHICIYAQMAVSLHHHLTLLGGNLQLHIWPGYINGSISTLDRGRPFPHNLSPKTPTSAFKISPGTDMIIPCLQLECRSETY